MQLEDLVDLYFNEELEGKAYEKEEEYDQDLFRFLDMALSIACSTKYKEDEEGKTLEIENAHLRGIPITSSEVIRALYASCQNAEEEFPYRQIRIELKRALAYIKSRKEATEISLSVNELARRLSLTPFVQFLVLLAWGNFYDAKYELLYAFLQGDVRRKLPSVPLAVALFELFGEVEREEISRAIFDTEIVFGTLLEYREDYDNIAFARTYTLSTGAWQYIQKDMSLIPFLKKYEVNWEPDMEPDELRQTDLTVVRNLIGELCSSKDRGCKVFNILGQQGNGRKQIVKIILTESGRQGVFLDIMQILSEEAQIETVVQSIYQECVLKEKILCLFFQKSSVEEDEKTEISSNKIEGFLKQCSRNLPFFIWFSEDKSQYFSSLGIPYISYEIRPLSITERGNVWKKEASQYSVAEEVDFELIGSQYLASRRTIKDALWNAEMNRKAKSAERIEAKDIKNAVKQQTANELGRCAKLIPAVYTWDSLVLPKEQIYTLTMICNQVKYRNVVGEEWGFYDKTAYGRGVCALFYGAPGTGKTMAVQVIANELGLNLYRIDLSQLISKYIGETEKNISRVFKRAKGMNAILFFDEADSIFAKRLDVKDHMDRSANAQTAHLLQEIENYDGLSILATNLVSNIDDAFKRRIWFMVKFPYPTEEIRLSLWQTILPAKIPCEEELDLAFFAEKFELSGSSIKEILTTAAFIAASGKRMLKNRDIVEAIKINYSKYGKLLTDEEFEHLI